MTAAREIFGLDEDLRILLLTPTRRDGEVTSSLLSQWGIGSHVCNSAQELVEEVHSGAGAILLTDEALSIPGIEKLNEALQCQPPWSDIPIVILLKSMDSHMLRQTLDLYSNATVVERPAPLRTVVSAIDAALRARKRQFQIRDQVNEIAEAAERFEIMANAIPQLAWMANANGFITWFNRRWFDYTGMVQGKMRKHGWQAIIEPETLSHVLANWRSSLEEGKDFEMEIPLRGADGAFRLFLTQAQPIRDDKGEIVRWFGTNTDIDDIRKLRETREQMLESERSARIEAERTARLKDEFLATLSHELRTPLSAILGWTYLMRKCPANGELVADGIQVIERSGESLKNLVEDLLDMSRIISGKLRLEMGSVDLPHVLTSAIEAVRPAAEAKNIQIERNISSFSQSLVGDSARIQQVVWNLLSNSVKFTPSGGSIAISLKVLDGCAVIEVLDSGQGIPANFVPHLFDRFRQADATAARKSGGMGIGLSLVKEFTEMHQGTVEAYSAGEGLGSCFTVRLPLKSHHCSSDSVTEGAGRLEDLDENVLPALRGVSVLVVDDEPDVRDFLERIFSDNGMSVRCAGSAAQALRLIEESEPQVLVSDIGMPEKDGYQLIREIRTLGHRMPAIALSAFAREEDTSRALEAGFQHHQAKPVNIRSLFESLAKLVPIS